MVKGAGFKRWPRQPSAWLLEEEHVYEAIIDLHLVAFGAFRSSSSCQGRGAHTDTNSYAVTQRELYPHAQSHAKAASDSTASPNAAVSALISSFPRRSLGESG